jgi:hypothetical protein
MTPAQQQIMAEFNNLLQQSSGQLQQLLQQAAGGCSGMIAQNPTDPMPLGNALTAIEQQAKGLQRRGGDSVGAYYDRICQAGSGEPAHTQMQQAVRGYSQWVEEAWRKFELHWRVEQFRAMWPHVQQALQKPAACTRCGGPLRRTTPHRSETISCPACQSANQVMPDAVVATYYGSMPHYFAEYGAIEKRFVHDRYKNDHETRRDADYAAGRERSEWTLEELKHRESLEKDYWQTYAQARVQYEGGGPGDVKALVDARMKFFYDEMNRDDVWRRAHGLQGMAEQAQVPAHLENVEDYGPLKADQLEDDLVHDQLLREAQSDPPRFESWLKQLGYRDAAHRAIVHKSFMRRHMEFLTTAEGIGLTTKAAMRAMNERARLMVAAGQSSGLLDPIEGVSLQVYANVQAKQANMKPEQFQQLLAQHQMDQAKWERVQKGWIGKMSTDTTGAVATEYSKAFMSAGQGQYGAAGAAAADAMGAGVMATQAPNAAAEPLSFDKYAEISGAMAAWTKQGKDISAGLDKHFRMTAQDFSNVSMYWSSKMMQDLSSFERLSQLSAEYEKRYMAMA